LGIGPGLAGQQTEKEMNISRKIAVSSLAMMVSLGVASGAVWAQDAQGNIKLDTKSKIETQHQTKGAADSEMKSESKTGGGMKAEGGTRVKGEADSQTKAEGSTRTKGNADSQMKAESKTRKKNGEQNAETSAGAKSDQKGQMKAEESGSMKKGEGSRAQMKSETRKNSRAASDSDRNMKNNETTKSGQAESTGTSNEKTGSLQKNGGVNVNVTTEQKTEIRQVIKTEDVQPVEHVTFDVDVGTSIPHSVHLHRLPPKIVKIVPEYESYEYFVLADGRIIIVDPDSYEIVYILA
jgi:hypothetical protein